MAKRQRLEVTVKDTIDFMYEMLIPNQNGIEFNASSLGITPSQVVSLLVDRNIIERTPVFSKNGRKFRYKWLATMAPTKVLYGSITQQLRDKQADHNKCCKANEKNAVKPEVKPIPEEDVKALEELKVKLDESAIDDGNERKNVSIVRGPLDWDVLDRIHLLWKQIKDLGGYIQDNELRVDVYVALK